MFSLEKRHTLGGFSSQSNHRVLPGDRSHQHQSANQAIANTDSTIGSAAITCLYLFIVLHHKVSNFVTARGGNFVMARGGNFVYDERFHAGFVGPLILRLVNTTWLFGGHLAFAGDAQREYGSVVRACMHVNGCCCCCCSRHS